MSYDMRGLAGVRGWLAFFVVTLALSAITSLIVPLQTKGTAPWYLTAQPGWSTYLMVAWLVALVRVGGYTYLAWLLNERQVAATPRTVITGLWLLAVVPIALDLASVALLLRIDLAALVRGSAMLMIRPAIYAAIWTAYLLRSRRVAVTYADDTDDLAAVFE